MSDAPVDALEMMGIAESLATGLAVLLRYTKDIEIVAEHDCIYFHTADVCGNSLSREDFDLLERLDCWYESTEHLHCFEFRC